MVTVRLSWELWASLAAGDGEDPETLLLEELPLEVIERVRLALWGPDWHIGAEPDGPARVGAGRMRFSGRLPVEVGGSTRKGCGGLSAPICSRWACR